MDQFIKCLGDLILHADSSDRESWQNRGNEMSWPRRSMLSESLFTLSGNAGILSVDLGNFISFRYAFTVISSLIIYVSAWLFLGLDMDTDEALDAADDTVFRVSSVVQSCPIIRVQHFTYRYNPKKY